MTYFFVYSLLRELLAKNLLLKAGFKQRNAFTFGDYIKLIPHSTAVQKL